MRKYVCGFLFNRDRTEVVLILKNRPAWQAGLFNGVGGKIEPGETPLQAMVREFWEETGVKTDPTGWQECLTISNRKDVQIDSEEPFIVHIYRGFVKDFEYDYPVTKTDEQVQIIDILDALPENVVPNLNWIIPYLMDDRTVGVDHIESVDTLQP